jgi:hypothetical protein
MSSQCSTWSSIYSLIWVVSILAGYALPIAGIGQRSASERIQPPLLLTAESFAERYIEVIKCAGAVACEAGAVHDGERFRF